MSGATTSSLYVTVHGLPSGVSAQVQGAGSAWRSPGTFSGLRDNTSYTFYARGTANGMNSTGTVSCRDRTLEDMVTVGNRVCWSLNPGRPEMFAIVTDTQGVVVNPRWNTFRSQGMSSWSNDPTWGPVFRCVWDVMVDVEGGGERWRISGFGYYNRNSIYVNYGMGG